MGAFMRGGPGLGPIPVRQLPCLGNEGSKGIAVLISADACKGPCVRQSTPGPPSTRFLWKRLLQGQVESGFQRASVAEQV